VKKGHRVSEARLMTWKRISLEIFSTTRGSSTKNFVSKNY